MLCFNLCFLKLIPTEYLLPGWSLCCNTMLFYLMHPASTVRQATSKAIKFLGKGYHSLYDAGISLLYYNHCFLLLVAKDTSNPLILKLVFSSLIMFWDLDKRAMSKSCLPSNYSDLPAEPKVYVCETAVSNPSISAIGVTDGKFCFIKFEFGAKEY